jgi:hypothetical protein
MQTGRTNQSAKLRFGPGSFEPVLDELEPGYPLIIHGGKSGWLQVTARARGLRTKDQRGWIGARLVNIDPDIVPDVPDVSHLLRGPEWRVAIAITIVVIATLLWLL